MSENKTTANIKNNNTNNNIVIDATGQSLGRLASKVAALLNGKSSTLFAKNQVEDIFITVKNASKVKVTGDKMNELLHKRYSGYPGGLKELTLSKVAAKKGYTEIIIHSVKGMLPKNRLQDKRLKNLSVTE